MIRITSTYFMDTMGNVYSSKESNQGLPSGGSTFEQSTNVGRDSDMNKEHVYGIVTTDQGLPSSRIRFGRSTRGSMGDRVTDLLRAIWIAAVAFLGAGLLGILPAFGQNARRHRGGEFLV